jgi:hypothetical protein
MYVAPSSWMPGLLRQRMNADGAPSQELLGVTIHSLGPRVDEPVKSSERLTCATRRGFVASPYGRFVMGRSWICFAALDGVAGAVLFGRVTRADAEALLAVVAATHAPGIARHPALLNDSSMPRGWNSRHPGAHENDRGRPRARLTSSAHE